MMQKPESYTPTQLFNKVRRRINNLCETPIEVFVFHAVSDSFDEHLNKRVDWSQTEEFKNHILLLKKKYTFISLEEAYHKLRRDWFRKKRYAVLTCDDGYASVLNILPFLEDEHIPVTLFINPKYLDGVSRREGYADTPQYITHHQLWSLGSPLMTIGLHGYEHLDATEQSALEFEQSVDKCIELLQSHTRYIPYFAYTWGRYTSATQHLLKKKRIIPVLTDGEPNYRYHRGISRKPIDSHYWDKLKI